MRIPHFSIQPHRITKAYTKRFKKKKNLHVIMTGWGCLTKHLVDGGDGDVGSNMSAVLPTRQFSDANLCGHKKMSQQRSDSRTTGSANEFLQLY